MNRPEPNLGSQRDVVGKRIVAVVIDLVVLAVVSGLVTGPLTIVSPRVGGAIGSLISTVLTFAYFTYMEGAYGQTLGKKVMDLVVVEEDGNACTMGAAAIRNVLRYIDWLPVFYLLGVVVMYLTEDRQRLGDVAADTVVVLTARTADVTPAGSTGEPDDSADATVGGPADTTASDAAGETAGTGDEPPDDEGTPSEAQT